MIDIKKIWRKYNIGEDDDKKQKKI